MADKGYDHAWKVGARAAQLAREPRCEWVDADGRRCPVAHDPDYRPGVRGKGQMNVDHIVPRSRGGSDDPSNLQTLCHRHHSLKTMYERRVETWRHCTWHCERCDRWATEPAAHECADLRNERVRQEKEARLAAREAAIIERAAVLLVASMRRTIQKVARELALTEHVCPCGVTFTAGPGRRYCSRGCYGMLKRVERTCEHCGVMFMRGSKGKGKTRFCSRECVNRWQRERAMKPIEGGVDQV